MGNPWEEFETSTEADVDAVEYMYQDFLLSSPDELLNEQELSDKKSLQESINKIKIEDIIPGEDLLPF